MDQPVKRGRGRPRKERPLVEPPKRHVGRPTKAEVAERRMQDAVDEGTDAYLRAERIVEAINKNLPKGRKQLAPIPKDYVFRARDREAVSCAMHAAFELIGGVPFLVAWAKDNPSQFMNIYKNLLPSNTETPHVATVINVQSAVPPSPLDNMTVDEKGNVIDISDLDGFTEQKGDDLPD